MSFVHAFPLVDSRLSISDSTKRSLFRSLPESPVRFLAELSIPTSSSRKFLMSKPKQQHYIPKMIVKRFSDSGGWLHCCRRSGAKPNFWKARPGKVFCEGHLYTRYDDGGKADESIEGYFSELESAVSPIIDKIVDWSLRGQVLHLDADEKDLWRRFFSHQRRRMPSLVPFVDEKTSDRVKQIPAEYEAYIGREITPEERSPVESTDFLERAKRNGFPSFAAAESRDDIKKILRNTSIITGVIRNPKGSFVIGNRAISTFYDWFPVHQKIAVRLASPAGSDELKVFNDISEVSQINDGIVRKSTIFAGPSRQLVASLVRP